MISQQRVDQYKQAYLKKFKVHIDDKEATNQLLNLVELVKTIYGDNLIRIVPIDKERKGCD